MSESVYLLAGEPFLADEALDKIRADTGVDPLSEVLIDATISSAEMLEALGTPTLFGGRRLVIVHDAHELKKDEREELERYIENPSPAAVLVLIAGGRTPLSKSVEKYGAVINLDVPKGRKLVAWLRERARTRGLKLDERAAWALTDAVGTELRDLDGALEQLQTGLGSSAAVGADDVRRAFSRLADERVFAFTDAVGERRLPVAMTALRRLLNQEDAPLMVFGALASHVRRLLIARTYADGGPRAVGDALGLPEWRAKRLHQQARSYRQEELTDAMQVLAETDLEMKGGDLSPEIALERAVIKIVEGRRS